MDKATRAVAQVATTITNNSSNNTTTTQQHQSSSKKGTNNYYQHSVCIGSLLERCGLTSLLKAATVSPQRAVKTFSSIALNKEDDGSEQ
ncbi:hypothetical protein PoB_007428200 [Plakobranchus ocellatus]|uniref:Uncharacterized protein n=1 Tax=Plakobranchus ocellatus TaxID=259542 RepID=A0AAV4DTX8_9GAST|nr:hypothetical protein PoB_007428200 [Plakobranchus ocellatus]